MSHTSSVARSMLRACLAMLLSLPGNAHAQRAGAGWQAGVGAGFAVFSAAARGTGTRDITRLTPLSTTVFGVSMSWASGEWELASAVDLLAAKLSVQDDAVTVAARNATLARVRWRILAGRTVAKLGEAAAWTWIGPALDLWAPDGMVVRARVAGVARMGLRFEAGAIAVENWIAGSISGSPLSWAELPDGYRGRVLRTVEVGLTVGFGL